MNHHALPSFWEHYRLLPEEIRDRAAKNFALLKANRHHPSVHFKKVGGLWSARTGMDYRALARVRGNEVYWIWIGQHSEYDKILS